MRAAAADHRLQLGERGRLRWRSRGRRLRVLEIDGVEQGCDRLADRAPVRCVVLSRPQQRALQRLHPGGIAQFRQSGPAQQRAQRRIAQRGPVELAEMTVAAVIFQQQGIADIVERRPILSGCQRAAGCPGDLSKMHGILSARPLRVARPIPKSSPAAPAGFPAACK